MELVSRKVCDLGICIIDIYRAEGDLYSSWDIVPQNSDGTFNRVPDARYGVNQPEGEYRIENFKPVWLKEIFLKYDSNGHTYQELEIRDGSNNIVCYRTC